MDIYYLRLEGVNLQHVLSDTDQLSAVRGGSLLLRKAVKDIEKRFPKLMKISTGASVGLFRVEDETQAASLYNNVVNFLNKNYQHFTFVVDIQKASADFLKDKEAVLARNRFRQMQQLSLAIPPINRDIKVEPCKQDGLRPGVSKAGPRQERKTVSISVRDRYYYGRRQKRAFYREEIGQDLGLSFTNDLQEISTDKRFRNLNNKLASVYLDGNGFGKIQSCPICNRLI
jgi:hypothetical protein